MLTSSEQGYVVKGLRSASAELLMVPELGGRIISLRSLRTGREWCWHQPRPDWLWSNDAGDAFGTSPQAGIDECVPTVAACQVRGRRIPDHGEVWYQDWPLDPEALTSQELRATVPLTVSPLVFSRGIRAESEGAFVFDYSLRNTGLLSEPYLWSFHPLLNLEPGDRLELPAEVRELRLNGGLGAPMALGDLWDYPEPFPGIRLDEAALPAMPGSCLKGFAGPLDQGFAALVNDRTGDRLEITWDATVIPYLGLWLNRGHGGFHHLALEPTSGAPDSLADAVESWNQHGVLPPRGTAHWSLRLNLS